MAKTYKPYSTEQKRQYAKRFSQKQVVSYRKGKRYGFLIGIHKKRRKK